MDQKEAVSAVVEHVAEVRWSLETQSFLLT